MLTFDNFIIITGSEERLLDFLKVHTVVSDPPSLSQSADEFIDLVYRDKQYLLHDERARFEYLIENRIEYPKWPYPIKPSFLWNWNAYGTAHEIFVLSESEICLNVRQIQVSNATSDGD